MPYHPTHAEQKNTISPYDAYETAWFCIPRTYHKNKANPENEANC